MESNFDGTPGVRFWAKTMPDGEPGLSVHAHCLNVGCVAEALMAALPPSLRALLPPGVITLAALHDVGKITLGFQAKCPAWLRTGGLPAISVGEVALSVTDHALVSQAFVQRRFASSQLRLWAVAVGAHHGRPKGKNAGRDLLEASPEWAEESRVNLSEELQSVFGPLPATPPFAALAPYHSDLWLLAGLISVADWIGSNEVWFSPERGQPVEKTRRIACEALKQIGWPGGRLRLTRFSDAFASERTLPFQPNALQQAVAEAALTPGLIILEGPMGCGKTEAALFAAQQLIAAGHQHGIYFALPTQVTSNRIHKRIERFLRNTLAGDAALRLAHGNAWLEGDFDMRLRPAFLATNAEDEEEITGAVREARSWFASAKQALLAPYGVGTIDQALQAIVAVKHFFVRRFALAGKVVILDEIHSYDIYTGALVVALIRELVNLRCSVIVLSATLTAARRDELLAAIGKPKGSGPEAYPLVTKADDAHECRHICPPWPAGHHVRLRAGFIQEEEILRELIARAEGGQHVLWIRNTVIEAQEALRTIAGSVRTGAARVGLLHSRFPFQRRAELELDWLEFLGPGRDTAGPGSILVATQVVEQSVDIDLDFMVSDLAPTDMLLQRIGRLWRHERPFRNAVAPEFWVRLPELSEAMNEADLKKALSRSARIYAPYVLLRTAAVWRGKDALVLPGDIRPLLEATYADPAPDEPSAWRDLHAELDREKATLAANAEAATLVLGRPMLRDEEEILTRRKGPPTTPLLLLRSVTTQPGGTAILTALDGSRIEVNEYEWRRASALFVHQSLVRVPRWMIPANAPRPEWLKLHGPRKAVLAIVRDDGRCLFDDRVSNVIYDLRLGIYAERPAQPAPQQNEDDYDEFDD